MLTIRKTKKSCRIYYGCHREKDNICLDDQAHEALYVFFMDHFKKAGFIRS